MLKIFGEDWASLNESLKKKTNKPHSSKERGFIFSTSRQAYHFQRTAPRTAARSSRY